MNHDTHHNGVGAACMSKDSDGVDSASLERIVPDQVRSGEATGEETLRLHTERYQFAKRYLVPGSVLDIACGVGYGTAVLSENPMITESAGVDIDGPSIQYATERYGSSRISYIQSDVLQFREKPFNNIVSLETLEHVERPTDVFSHLVSLLAPQGRLIASVPVTPSVDGNPHHKTNFSERRFRELGEALALKYVGCLNQHQPFRPFAILARQEARSVNIRQNLGQFYLSHPTHFLLRLWSTVRDGFVNKYLTVVWER